MKRELLANYLEYVTSDETILYVDFTVEHGVITKIYIETDRGLEASERRYKEVMEYIANNLDLLQDIQ